MSLEPVNVPVAGGRKVNLILVANRQVNQEGDFWKLASFVREMCSDVEPVVVVDGRHRLRKHWWGRRASMVFSAVPLKKFAAVRGRVYQGSGLGKADEYRALERAGVAVPRWRLLTEAEPRPDVTRLGPYVVVKPDRGGRGAMA
jgi:hypothetical protein